VAKGGSVQVKRILAVAFAWTLAFSVWAQDADVVARAEAMVRAGRYAEAYQLLEPLEDKLAGDVKYDYLLARSALETGRPSQASFIYERILAVDPNYVGVRLEMGRAYLALGDYARAKLEFETVLRFSNLPPDLREQAVIYGKAAEDRLAGKTTLFKGYIEYGYGYDSNPQSNTSVSQITAANGFTIFLDRDSLKRSDHYHALTAGGEVIHGLTERFSVYAGGDARIRGYRELDIADYQQLDGRAGFGYNDGPNSGRIGVIGGRYFLDHQKVRDNAGFTADYRRLIGTRNQISVSLLGAGYRYLAEPLKVNDYDLYQGSIGWLGVVSEGRGVVGLSLLGGFEKATEGRSDGDKPFYGGRLTLQHTLTERIGIFVLGGVQRGKYKERNPTFDTTRLDTLYDLVGGLTWSFARGWSLRPQVLYLKNKSNISLFEYDRTDVSLNVRFDF
jgi:tetratricopeptide (TPR) repeat protein